jgi:hypothetical protein
MCGGLRTGRDEGLAVIGEVGVVEQVGFGFGERCSRGPRRRPMPQRGDEGGRRDLEALVKQLLQLVFYRHRSLPDAP